LNVKTFYIASSFQTHAVKTVEDNMYIYVAFAELETKKAMITTHNTTPTLFFLHKMWQSTRGILA